MTISTLRPWVGAAEALDALESAIAGSHADQLEIFLASRVAEHTRFASDRIHQAQSITECQVMVRAIVGTGSARVAVSSLAKLPGAIEKATLLALDRDGVMSAPTPYHVSDVRAMADPAGLWYASSEHWDVAARSLIAGRVMDEGRLAGGTVNGNLTAAVTELAVATSSGARAYACATESGFSMTVRIGEASSYIADLGRDVDALGVEERATTAVAAMSAVREIVPVPDGVHDVVFGPLASGELVGFVPDFGFTAPAVRAGVGLVAERPGVMIASPLVTIADDVLSPTGLPFPFDFEGSPKQRVGLIENGRVGRPLSDLASASVTGGVATGHAYIGREQSPDVTASNLVMSAGDLSEIELIGGVERGIYVQRLWYNRLVDPEAGTVVGTSRDACFLIEDGAMTKGLAGGRFNESVIGALLRTDGIGDTLCSQPIPNVWNGCITAPAIRVRGFRFGATTRETERE